MRVACTKAVFLFVVCLLHATTLVKLTEASNEAICHPDEVGGRCVSDGDDSRNWADQIGDKLRGFLKEKVLRKNTSDRRERDTLGGSTSQGFLSFLDKLTKESKNEEDVKPEDNNPLAKFLSWVSDTKNFQPIEKRSSKSQTEEVIASLLERAQRLNEDDHSVIGMDFVNLLQGALSRALDQLWNTFGDIIDSLDASVTISMLYFLTEEDAKKNPSWKRRQHRFCEKVSRSMVMQLHDALYLSQLAYVNSVDDFRKGLTKFQGNQWELAYGTTDSLPHLPAHFMLIHKELGPLATREMEMLLPWEGRQKAELTVILVVRGTKNVADALADVLLEPEEYRGGYAHGGILENGKNLAAKYLLKLEELLKHSGRDKIKLYLIGHSLGAAAASIAAMEFHDHSFIEVEALGFGCPSLLSADLSAETKSYVTTVVADADIIPRMSGASVANFLLDLLEYDWTTMAMEDLEFTLEKARSVLPIGKILPKTDAVLEWTKAQIERDVVPNFMGPTRERMPPLLMPPGNCVHLYRDGVGYTGAVTPCSFFTSLDFTRTLIDDHLIMPGYHRALLSMVRDWDKDFNFDFPHDIAAIKT